jgi:hypothetical protein
MTNVQERAPATAVSLQTDPRQNALNQAAVGMAQPGTRSRDMIRRIAPQYAGVPVDVPPGRGNGIIQQLLSIIQELLSALGMGGLFGGFGGFGGFGFGSQGPGTYFQNATGASVGDPHLSFTGTNDSGGNERAHFDSMASQADLLDSDSFTGGYQISTNVTRPGANGITYNQQATIGTEFGQTQVSLDNGGNAIIEENGQTFSLASGQSYSLGGGETVTRNADGSVVVVDGNGMGGSITTTLRVNGNGVDVNTQANNVDLGGELVNQSALAPIPGPIMQPMLQ